MFLIIKMEELIKTLEHEKQLSLNNVVKYREVNSRDAELISQGEVLAFEIAINHVSTFLNTNETKQ